MYLDIYIALIHDYDAQLQWDLKSYSYDTQVQWDLESL